MREAAMGLMELHDLRVSAATPRSAFGCPDRVEEIIEPIEKEILAKLAFIKGPSMVFATTVPMMQGWAEAALGRSGFKALTPPWRNPNSGNDVILWGFFKAA